MDDDMNHATGVNNAWMMALSEGKKDSVNHPSHYTDTKIECIDYMEDNMTEVGFMGYLEGCVKKYLHRYRYKGKPVEDLRKANWYLERLIKKYEGEK